MENVDACNSILYCGNYARIKHQSSDTYFWFNMKTGEIVLDGATEEYRFYCQNQGYGYIAVEDADSKCGIIDTASGTFSGYKYDFDLELHTYPPSNDNVCGYRNDNGTGIIILSDENDYKLLVCDRAFNKLHEYENAEIISCDSNGNYLIHGGDDYNYCVVHPDGTVSKWFYLRNDSSVADHNLTTIVYGDTDKCGLARSDGSIILDAAYDYIGPEYNGISQAIDDWEYAASYEHSYSCGYFDINGDWLIQGEYYAKNDGYATGRCLVLEASDGYIFYDLDDYINNYNDSNKKKIYKEQPTREITEDDLYGDYYNYLNNRSYSKMFSNILGDMKTIDCERTELDDGLAIFISNMKAGGIGSVLNAFICDVTGEYYNQKELEEEIARVYLEALSGDSNEVAELASEVSKDMKITKKGYQIIESGFKNNAEKKELAEMLSKWDLEGKPLYTKKQALEEIRAVESNWDHIDKIFDAAGYVTNAAEVTTAVLSARYLDEALILKLLKHVDVNSELYRGLSSVHAMQKYPAERIVAKLFKDDVFGKICSEMTKHGVGRLSSLFAGTGGIKVGMATTVASIGYYTVGSMCDYFGANSDELVSALISIHNYGEILSALTGIRMEMRSENSGKNYKEDYKFMYQALLISLNDGAERVLKIAKNGKSKERLKTDLAFYKSRLTYRAYIKSCLKNANAAIEYTVEDGKATIVGYNKTAPKLRMKAASQSDADPVYIDIPETVGGYEVVAVGPSAFKGKSNIAGVYVPAGIKVIGGRAFEDCGNLQDVFLEEGTTHIGDRAFAGCTSLENVTLPGSVTELGVSVFDGIDEVNISAKDTTVIDGYIANNEYNNLTSTKIAPALSSVTITNPAEKQSYMMSEIAEIEAASGENGNFGMPDLTGLELKAVYEDGTEETVTSDKLIGYFEEKKPGENKVTVCYGDQSTQYTVNVEADECSYEIMCVDERGKEIPIADKVTGKALAGTDITVEGETLEGYTLVSEPRTETIGAFNSFEIEYKTKEKPSVFDADVTLPKTKYEYTGKEITPAVTVTYDGKTLVRDTDYTLTYDNNLNFGQAAVVIEGIGSYGGISINVFEITPKKATPAVTLSKYAYTYNGKVNAPTVTVKVGSKVLKTNTDYTITYAKGRKNVGKYSVKATLKGNYSGSKTVYFKINPKGATIKTPAKAKKSFTAKWSKQSGKMSSARITGYQIQYALNGKFTKSKKTVNVKGYKTTSKTIKKLKAKKKYYVRVRTYMKTGGAIYYSPWSKVKSVKTK